MTTAEVEGDLIARLVVDPSPVALLRLTTEDFSVPLYAKAWTAMRKMAAEGRTIDLITLSAEGVDLTGLVTTGRAPVEEYAALIRRDAFRRRASWALEDSLREVGHAPDEPSILAAVQAGVTHILSGYSAPSMVTQDRALADFRPRSGGLRWGFPRLDDRMQPARAGDSIILAALTSVGKTLVAEHIAASWAAQATTPVLFVSIEMSVQQLMERAAKRGIDAGRPNLVYLDEGRVTTAVVRQRAAELRMRYGAVTGIVIDYLQLLGDPGDSPYVRISSISAEVKRLAREFACPVLTLSQLSRNSAREKRRPRLDDLRDSGAIEQDADIVFLLWRPSLDSSASDLAVAKNRHGPADMSVSLNFDLPHMAVTG